MWNTQFENRGPDPGFCLRCLIMGNGLGSLTQEGRIMRLGYHGWTKTAVRWPNRIGNGINAYPLVGLALVLLIIFMIVTGVTPHHHGWGVDLPRTWHASPLPRAIREDAQIVSVLRDGAVFYRNQKVRADDLADQIRESVRNGADQKIYIRADSRAKYGDVKYVLGEIAKTGIQNVCFFAEKVSP
jgi:biopolymer transport protein TolR